MYTINIEYTWNREIIRKSANIKVKVADWNPLGNNGRGELRASYNGDYKRLNNFLLSQINKYDTNIYEYYTKHPNQITANVIRNILNDKPINRADEGRDFVEFALSRLDSEFNRHKIGFSKYKSDSSCMNVFSEFLRATGKGTYKEDGIYIGEISSDLIEDYIDWRRKVKKNTDGTINHSLTPILKATRYATERGWLDNSTNSQIQEMRIAEKASLKENMGEKEFDGRYLTDEKLMALINYYKKDTEVRRQEYIEMFLFAVYAAGLRLVDVATLQWGHIDLKKKELRKIQVKTNKRNVIPLNKQAIDILNKWGEKRKDSLYVFDIMPDTLDLDNEEELYKARNNADKCVNQSLKVVGKALELPFELTFHVARHTFAVLALEKGLEISVISRLLGHGSTDITERVYAQFLPDKLAGEMAKVDFSFLSEKDNHINQ